MPTFKKFDEYLDSKSKLVSKPKKAIVADYTGGHQKSPPVSGRPGPKFSKADMMGAPKKGDFHPIDEPLPQPPMEKGLAHVDGNRGTAYQIGKPIAPVKGKPGFANLKGRRSTTEDFLNATAGMSPKELTRYVLGECDCKINGENDEDELPTVTAYTTGDIHPHPPEAIKYVVALAKKNPRMLDALVHEIKRSGALHDTVGSLMDQPETFDSIAGHLGDEETGPARSGMLASAMNDDYDDFLNDQDGMYEGVSAPKGVYDDEDGSGDKPHDIDAGPDSEEPDADGDDKYTEPEDGNEGPPGMHNDDQEEQPKPKKLKKKFAHDHLIQAMGRYGHMRGKMKDAVSDDIE